MSRVHFRQAQPDLRHYFFMMLFLFASLSTSLAAPFPVEQGEAVIKRAVIRASSCIVRIETIGGLDLLDGQLTNTGPTTGVIVSDDGYIITSSFNFAANPSSILVTLPESKKRLPAIVVARDHLKNLTLLKAEAQNLTPAKPVDLKQIRVGQWSIALGRTYASPLPNVSLGLISALGRIDGKAIQTDAKVSPANYGGPLVDIHGDVMGILVPLSPTGKGLTEGVNWYDSGIGFAIPLQDVLASLDRLKTGKDLKAGLMGVSFGTTPPFLAEPVLQEIRPNSPAAKAGLKTKDRIISLQGEPVKTVANVKQKLGRKYAGETVSLVVKRGEKTEKLSVTLTDKLEPFRQGWLGILGRRITSVDSPGAIIRYVFPGSPAEKAGLKKQDRITGLDELKLFSYDQLRDQVFLKQPGEELELTIVRDDKTQKIKITTEATPGSIVDQLPLPILTQKKQKEAEKELKAKTGEFVKTLAEHQQKYRLYVPEDYQHDAAYGLAFWLSASGEPVPKKELAQWKRICRTRGFILVMPVSENLEAFSSDDVNWLLDCIKEVEQSYRVDSRMTCLITTGKDVSFPWLFVFEHKEVFEGLFSMGIPRRFRAPFNEPGYRLQVLISATSKEQQKIVDKLQKYLDREGYPVTSRPKEKELSVEDFDVIGRWLDSVGAL